MDKQLKDCQDPFNFLNEPDAEGKTALYWALDTKQTELFHFLLNKMIEFDQSEYSWFDPHVFIEACAKADAKILKGLFLLWGIEADFINLEVLQMGLEEALEYENKEMVQYLLQNTDVDKNLSLSDHIDKDNPEFFTFLLELGIDPNTLSESGLLPLCSIVSSQSK